MVATTDKSATGHKGAAYVLTQCLYKHQGAELKANKAALDKRAASLEAVQQQLRMEHEEARSSIAAFKQQIDELTGIESVTDSVNK